MLQSDSIDKVVTRYFATVTRESFTFNGKRFDPKPLKVSPLLLRDYTCPAFCSGCCFRFTLDYLPSEEKPEGVSLRKIEFNGRKVEIWTDPQLENKGIKCKHSDPKDGRCGIYSVRPFTCDFELIRTLQNEDPDRANTLTQKLFGRGWSYTRVDGGKGALCEMTPVTEKSIKEVVRKLNRLKQWAEHFKLHTWADEILKLIENGTLQRSTHSIVFDNRKQNVKYGMGL